MNIRQKMLLGAAALTLIPVALTALGLWYSASGVAGGAVDNLTQSQLVSLRDTKRQQVVADIDTRVRTLQSLAAQRSTVDGFRALKAGYASAAKDTGITPEAAAAAANDYLTKQFTPEWAKRNVEAVPDINPAAAARDPNGAALQTEFIVNNPNPLGQKERMAKPPGSYPYALAHAQFHPSFERAQKLGEFYDIFLIDTDTDTVIYTVYKELDFATPLTGAGIAAKSNLAQAYSAVKAAPNRDAVKLSDFLPYLPSYNDQAAFAAAPVFDGDRQIGVIAVQFPIDKISEALSSNRSWKQIGLGDTGDAFLVGPDKLMRTNARYVAEDAPGFLTAMGDKLNPASKNAITKKSTSIGLVTVDSESSRAALAGQTGFIVENDYRGIPSYEAYAPLQVQGLNWGIVAKINADEARATTRQLNTQSLLAATLIGLGVVAAAGLAVTYFLRRFLRPIATLSDTVKAVTEGDTAARSKLEEKDEIGDLGRSFDRLLDERLAALQKAAAENEVLNNSVINLLQTVFQLSNKDLTARAPVTEDVVGTLSSSINQLSDETGRTLKDVQDVAEQVRQLSESVRSQAAQVQSTAEAEQQSLRSMSANLTQATDQLTQVAALSDQSNQSAERAAQATQAALAAVDGTVKGMDGLRESISEMEKRFKRLGERSQEISTVVQLINSISERTHVLALNASMQAATAGEAGRGFAVVAEEVQRLSDSSRQATAQISQLVANIQGETNETLFTVNRLIGEVVNQSELAQRAGAQMTQTQQTTAQLVSLVRQIAQFSQEQAKLASTLQQSVLDINEGAALTSRAISLQTASTQTLVSYAAKLTESVGQFKLPQTA
jgi:methyl-accepting chemotaxis protein